jgi:two-component system chemotaxis response regulator CheY
MTLQCISNGVILAENDALLRAIVRSVLVSAEQQVFLAADGLEAVGLARQFKARLVLLDIGMPRLNGLLACKTIRALPGYADVPIVMLTGYDNERMRQAARQVGANDFITKPFRPDVLLGRLASFLVLPAGAAVGCCDDGLRGGRAHVWNDTPNPGAACGGGARAVDGPVRVWEKEVGPAPHDNPQLIEGGEAIRIYREAERRS